MPIVSRQQQKLMYTSLKPGSNTGVDPKVAKEYVQSTPAETFKTLPQFVKHHDKNEAKKRALNKLKNY